MANGTQKSNPSPPSLVERIRGKRTKDIRLPMPASGTRDKRLPRPTLKQQAEEGVDRYRDVMRTMGEQVRKARPPAKRAVKRSATRR